LDHNNKIASEYIPKRCFLSSGGGFSFYCNGGGVISSSRMLCIQHVGALPSKQMDDEAETLAVLLNRRN
jgi:hypothetical protein